MAKNVGTNDGLTAKLVQAVGAKQEELEHVARVLHEDVGQVLTVTGLHLGVLQQDFGAENPGLAERVVEIQALLEHALGEVRRLSYKLNPGMVPRSGLRYALDSLIGRIRDESGRNIRFLMDWHVHPPQHVAVSMYEIVEHALRNAVQHTEASRIEVVLQPAQDQVRLEIRDNGQGFDLATRLNHGLGFVWMQYRAKQAGLVLSVQSTPEAGTTVQVMYKEPAAAREQERDNQAAEHEEVKGYAIRNPLG